MKERVVHGIMYEPIDLRVTGVSRSAGKNGNSYTDIEVCGEIEGPRGERVEVPGFWDGDASDETSVWVVRYAPPGEGEWRYTIRGYDPADGCSGARKAENAVFVQRGVLQVRAGTSEGFLVRDDAHPFAFRRSAGGSFLPMGDTLWNAMSDLDGMYDFSVFEEIIRRRADQKFNFVRSYTCPFYPAPDNRSHANNGGIAFEPWDPDHLNPAYFREIDRRIACANEQGMIVNLVLGSDGDHLTRFFGWDNGKLERYVRYCCARYSAFDVCWEGRAEYEEQRDTPPGAVPLAKQIGEWIERYDPHGHLQSMHTTDSNSELAEESWLDWIMHQAQDWSWIGRDRRHNKPVMNEEFYYENSGAGATHDHHVDSDTLRRGAWKVMCSGASGLAYGNTGTIKAGSVRFGGLRYTDSPGARYMTNLYTFWEQLDYRTLAPLEDHAVEKIYALGSEGGEYVAYLETGGEIDIRIPAGRYTVRWYDPKTGSYDGEHDAVSHRGGAIRCATGQGNERVLHIKPYTEREERRVQR